MNRASYVPAACGATNCSVAPVPPPRYFHATELVSGEPTSATATQSVAFPGPLAATTVSAPPVTTLVGDTVIVGPGATSSFRMVPTPCAVPSSALVGFVRFTRNVSSGSDVVSPFTRTVIVCAVTPGAKVRVPLVAVKSLPPVAVPSAVAYATVTELVLAGDKVTVNVAGVGPLFPSRTVTRLIASVGGL